MYDVDERECTENPIVEACVKQKGVALTLPQREGYLNTEMKRVQKPLVNQPVNA